MSWTGINRLARVMDQRIGKHLAANSSVVVELGVIQSDRSLQCDHFGPPVPKGGWYMTEAYNGKLSTGAVVLVAWINDGTIPVVIDKVVSS